MERFPNEDGPEPRSAPSPSRPVEKNLQIESYLDTVLAPLIDIVPPARLRELRAELAAHAAALVEAHRELGSEPDAAVDAALEQLGDARCLGAAWARERRRPASAPRWQEAAHLGRTFIAGLTLTASGSLGAALLVALEQHLGHNLFELALGGPLLPLVAGALVGQWHNRHPLGSRGGLLLIALAGAGISLLMAAADPRPPLAMVIRVLLWLMTACASAGLGALIASGGEFLSPGEAAL
jgi:hypothetical protein